MFFVAVIAAFAWLPPQSAQAYVGPGAGITMLGALWAVILAVVFALAGILIWPVRALLHRRRSAASAAEIGGAQEAERDETP